MSVLSAISRLFAGRSETTSSELGGRAEATYFLLVFNPKTSDLVSIDRFTEDDEAMRRFAEAEQRLAGDDVQVVMFRSDSLETVHSTHPHYFNGSAGPSTDPFGFKPVAAH